ncbi:MAG TPA: ADP-ribosylglycohydrolase family protein [Actinomycetota bacterium]|nr:ADP-ribosylglycohydrolase family protein [Actinomycetota bacterium]
MIIGARVGDAMGAPTEGLSAEEIGERFGWVDEFTGEGSDDSLMAALLAGALLESGGHAGADEWAAQWIRRRDLMMSRRDRFFPSVLHVAEKLAYGMPPRSVAAGTMASSSSAMCIWPVGLVNAGDPRAAALQAYALAALIHVGEVDFCQDAAAAVAAAVAVGVRPGTGMREACAEALAVLHPVSGESMRDLISAALALAGEVAGYEEFRTRYLARFRQPIPCDSRETVPAAFALATLAGGDLRRGVELAANFGRDTDTIASMTGALCGAIGGPEAVPEEWITALGPSSVADAEQLAGRLADLARGKAAERDLLSRTVPGLADG